MSRDAGQVCGRAAVTVALGAVILAVAGLGADQAWAQAHNPFGVGVSEGGGYATGFTGWILQEQVVFERQLSAAIRAVRSDGSELWWLAGLSFAYGVFHAAGPGHGKAVMTSYLFANERALRRGLVLTLAAALLQGLVAVLLVGVLALVLHVTAPQMKGAATLVESLSYAGVAVLGLWLVWQKGRRFVAALRLPRLQFSAAAMPDGATGGALAVAGVGGDASCGCGPGLRFQAFGDAAPAAHLHGPSCGHVHAPDPSRLDQGFSWSEASLTVMAAGLRPCSGAILVLVFALAQGMFLTGIASVFAMSLGTAITTGTIAAIAVLAKGLAVRFSAPETRRGALLIRGLEVAAALVVLAAGVSLFLGYTSMGGA